MFHIYQFFHLFQLLDRGHRVPGPIRILPLKHSASGEILVPGLRHHKVQHVAFIPVLRQPAEKVAESMSE